MAGNSFGQTFRITTAGESHGPGNVVIIDGVPPGIPLVVDDFSADLNRRRPGQSKIVTQRKESDAPEILSGVFEGKTTGTSIAILIRNQDQRSRDYGDIKDKYRPGHADYTFDAKYGLRDYRGGGRSSARETTVRVAAGVVAKKLLAEAFGGRVVGYVVQVGDVRAEIADPSAITLDQVETQPDGEPNIIRCPDPTAAAQMIELIDKVRLDGDSIGGGGGDRRHEHSARSWRTRLRQDESRSREKRCSVCRRCWVWNTASVSAVRLCVAARTTTSSRPPSLPHRTRVPYRKGRPTRSPHNPTDTAGCWAGSPVGNRSCYEQRSNRRAVSRRSKTPSPRKPNQPRSAPKAVTIRACSLVSFQWPKRWLQSHWRTIGCVGKPSAGE